MAIIGFVLISFAPKTFSFVIYSVGSRLAMSLSLSWADIDMKWWHVLPNGRSNFRETNNAIIVVVLIYVELTGNDFTPFVPDDSDERVVVTVIVVVTGTAMRRQFIGERR